MTRRPRRVTAPGPARATSSKPPIARTTSPVWIDQARSFGRPCLTGTRVQVTILADLRAAGEPIEAIAQEFNVRPAAVAAALEWHRSQQPAAWRAVWENEFAARRRP
jgi:uncharacterized protein (DUF433 family)